MLFNDYMEAIVLVVIRNERGEEVSIFYGQNNLDLSRGLREEEGEMNDMQRELCRFEV